MTDQLIDALVRDGIVQLPDLLSREQVGAMQRAFESRLRRLRWNNVDGYEKTERYRRMVQDVLTLSQSFVDAALHPTVKGVLRGYLGNTFALVEAKGWRSLPTRRDFHGWHGDAWYDQAKVADIPREVKLGIYLSDVKSGAFNYIAESHRKQAPRGFSGAEVDTSASRVVEITGPAGTAFLFDTSGIHRQACPILEPRNAVFYNYHDPHVPLQKEDVDYHRYHPLILNAAFLGKLSAEDVRILGFGETANYIEAHDRGEDHPRVELISRSLLGASLFGHEWLGRLLQRSRRLFSGRFTTSVRP